jgi:hypothetical protein
MRDAVLDYIGQVNGIPPEKVSEIRALIEEGKIDEANAMLDEASRTRDAAIQAEALTAQAESDLNHVARARNVKLTPWLAGTAFDSGGHIPSGETGIVAEKRAEFVNGVLVRGPADVTGGAQTAAILARGAGAGTSGSAGAVGGNTYNVTLNVAPGSNTAEAGRVFVEAIQDYERVNSARWRAS